MNTKARPAVGGHPATVLIVAAMGIIGITCSLGDLQSPKMLHTSILAGLAVGLPTVLAVKWFLRSHKDYYAEFYTTPLAGLNSWRLQKSNFMFCLILYVSSLVSVNLGHDLHVPRYMVLSILYLLLALAYPEQNAIWLAAKARLAESETSA